MRESSMTIGYLIQKYNNLESNAEDLEKALKQMGHSIDKHTTTRERDNIKKDQRLAVQLLFKEWERIDCERLEFINTTVKLVTEREGWLI